MERCIVYVSRLTRLPLLSSDGADVGRVADVVIGLGGRPPRVNGLVVAVQRRRVFIGMGRVADIESDGVRLRRASVNLRQFELRPGERLLDGELVGREVRGQKVVDIGMTPAPEPFAWEVATVALGHRRVPGRRRAPEVIDWSEAGELFADERPLDRQAATPGQTAPSGDGGGDPPPAAQPPARARRRARGRAAGRSAQGALRGRAGANRGGARSGAVARVLDEMEADDAADLLAEFSATERAELLGAMDPEEAEPVRRLLTYEPDTAGGLMTPEPVILAPQATVAQALARVRDPDLPVPLAAQVFVAQPPLETRQAATKGWWGFSACCARRRASRSAAAWTRKQNRSTPISVTVRSRGGSPPTTWSHWRSLTRSGG
jgi:sporulation protein YlmC with PRC-barrel domain